MTQKQIRKMLLRNLEDTQVRAFEQKKRGERSSVRRFLQVTESIEALKKTSKKRRTVRKTS